MNNLFRTMLVLTLCACAHSGQAHTQETPDPMGTMPPMGLGSLTQADISISIANTQLTIRFEPLNERLLRLLAPDAYRALAGMIASRRTAIDSISRYNGTTQPGLMLVTVYGNVPDVRFDASSVGVAVNSLRFNPIGVIPLDANFNRGQLAQQQVGMGLYVFSEELPVYSQLTFTYGSLAVEGWPSKIQTFDRELARVSARARSQAQQQTPDSTPPK
jgi:hypothetical protein